MFLLDVAVAECVAGVYGFEMKMSRVGNGFVDDVMVALDRTPGHLANS